MTKLLRSRLAFILLTAAIPYQAIAQDSGTSSTETSSTSSSDGEITEDDLFNMSLEELMSVMVNSGNLVGISSAKNPVAITTITQDDILLSAARNINDLIDIYVPGAMILMHSTNEKVGIRGVVSDRNYKYIALVDGVNINDQSKQGAHSELSNWDLNDIEKIEIIRGPGSVTYGAGAVGGVINITTKTGKSFTKLRAGLTHDNTYGSNGAYVEKGAQVGLFSLYGYASYRQTDGFDDPDMYKINVNTDVDYMGKDSTNMNVGPQEYLSDPMNKYPGIKAKIDIGYKDSWRLMSRFTQGGINASMNTQREYEGGLNAFRANAYRNFMTSIKNEQTLSDKFTLNTQATFLSQENLAFRAKAVGEDYAFDYITNRSDAYSEKEIVINSRLNFDSFEKLKISAGLEYMNIGVNKAWGWGLDNNEFFINEAGQNFVSSGDAYYFNDTVEKSLTYDSTKYTSVGDKGLRFNIYSVFGEANYDFNDNMSILVSSRADLTDGSGILFSPRAAFIAKLKENHYLKVIAQQSVRMTTLPTLYLAAEQGVKTDPERVRGIEIMYNGVINDKIMVNANTFYNNIQSIGWDGSKTGLVGTLDLAGIEVEAKYKTESFMAILSHSFTKQLGFEMPADLLESGATNAISYSSYNKSKNSIVLTGNGNDLNNWSNHATKFILRYKTKFGVSAQVDGRVYYGMQGAKDGYEMYENAYASVDTSTLSASDLATYESQKELVLANIEEARGENMFKASFRMNLAIAYVPKAFEHVEIVVYAQNLLSMNNYRYGYDWGAAQYFPNSTMFVKEPRTFGVKLNCSF